MVCDRTGTVSGEDPVSQRAPATRVLREAGAGASTLDSISAGVAHRLDTAGACGQPVIVVTEHTSALVPAVIGCFRSGCIAVPLGALDTLAAADLRVAIRRAAAATGATHLLRFGQGEIGEYDGLTAISAHGAEVDASARGWSVDRVSAADIALIQFSGGRLDWDGIAFTFGNLVAAADSIDSLGVDPAYPLSWPVSAGLAGLVALTLAPQRSSGLLLYDDIRHAGAPLPWPQSPHASALVVGDASVLALAADDVPPEQSRHLLIEASSLSGAGADALSRLATQPGYRITLVYQPPAAALPIAARAYCDTDRATHDGRLCVGAVVSGHRVVVVADEQATAGDGEIWVGGASVAVSYWRDPERTERVCRAYTDDGNEAFVRTGQSGRLDSGDLYVGGGHASDRRREQVLEWLHKQAARALGSAGVVIDAATPLAEYGFDSMMLANLVAEIETHFGISLPLASVHASLTIGELTTRIATATATTGRRPRRDATLIDPAFTASTDTRLRELDENGLCNPYFRPHDSVAGASTSIDGRRHVNFASYNYLALCGDPRVDAAAKDAIDRLGTSVSASRLVSGERDVHRRLEQALAQFLGVEDCVVFVSGHLTNMTTLGQLAGPGDLILYDELAHDSLLRGVQLSGAAGRPFPHNDCKSLDALVNAIRADYDKVIIVAEGAYSMDGDVADLPGLIEVRERHGAFLMVDEAHSIGVLGATGRGVTEHFGVPGATIDIAMGTLSKALASCGGYIAGSAELVRYLKYNASGFVFSVGMPPPSAAAALSALEILQQEPQRIERLQRNAELFRELARQQQLDIGSSAASPIVPLILGDSMLSIALSQRLGDLGINVQPIVYPAVAEGAARLRFFICADHDDNQIADTVTAVARELQAMRGSFATSRNHRGGEH